MENPVQKFNRRFQIHPFSKQDAEGFAVRFWAVPPFVDESGIHFFDIRQRQGKWIGYAMCPKQFPGQKRQISIPEIQWNRFAECLRRNEILNIPDESKLVWDLYGIVNGEKRKTYILDGWRFYFAVMDKGKSNMFSYHNPQDHKWPEAKRVVKIIEGFRKLKNTVGIN
jgi:hypothetical protein